MSNISITNIYWMLAYAFRSLNELKDKDLSSEEFENIYDLFSFILTKELNKQLKRGLNKDYISIQEELPVIKGKVLINECINNSSLDRGKVYCEHDEYSSNCYLNQIVKTACYYLIRSHKVKNKEKLSQLKKTSLYLNEVDVLDVRSIKWNQIRYNRFNASYKMLVNVSYLVLDGLLVTESNGNLKFKNYIDDQKMHHLYEKFILEYYKYHYPELKPSVPQVEWNVDKENPFIEFLPKMQTDITLYYKDRILIIDAKYYSDMYQNNPLFNKETFKSNNLYQIYTYVKNEDKFNTGKVSGMLLYAKTDKNDQQWAEYKMGENKIIVSNLDLSGNFEQLSKELNIIADKLVSGLI